MDTMFYNRNKCLAIGVGGDGVSSGEKNVTNSNTCSNIQIPAIVAHPPQHMLQLISLGLLELTLPKWLDSWCHVLRAKHPLKWGCEYMYK
jgi:hypothetical protein